MSSAPQHPTSRPVSPATELSTCFDGYLSTLSQAADLEHGLHNAVTKLGFPIDALPGIVDEFSPHIRDLIRHEVDVIDAKAQACADQQMIVRGKFLEVVQWAAKCATGRYLPVEIVKIIEIMATSQQ